MTRAVTVTIPPAKNPAKDTTNPTPMKEKLSCGDTIPTETINKSTDKTIVDEITRFSKTQALPSDV
jgi:hypothetical protein